MLDLVQELREKKLQIETEYRTSGSGNPTVRSIAESFGYEYCGVGCIDELENKYVLFLSRQTRTDAAKYNALLDKLKQDGHELTKIKLSYAPGVVDQVVDCDLLLDKQYEDRGRVGVMERGPTKRKAVAALRYDGTKPLVGVFLDTSPEHVGIIEELAIYLGMDTSAASQVPKVFRDLIRGLDI